MKLNHDTRSIEAALGLERESVNEALLELGETISIQFDLGVLSSPRTSHILELVINSNYEDKMKVALIFRLGTQVATAQEEEKKNLFSKDKTLDQLEELLRKLTSKRKRGD